MPKKNILKNNSRELKKTISPILIANDKYFRPYIELFEYSGENIIQQQLGTLLGIFEIRDDSEDSAYVVNFLTSVAKKEYFINPKRSVPESFEAALHKVNLALSELANHGNVNWIGKLDAVICVLERNYLHFSVAGNSKVMLLRNQALTDISEDIISAEPDPHPLKTFTNVSSGKLEAGDKIILTGEDLFQVFSLTEIKKGALRFNREQFVQFIQTALINELEIAGTIIIDTYEEAPTPDEASAEKVKEINQEKKNRLLNVFSERTFQRSPTRSAKLLPPEKLPAEENDYVDEKTGHIYVQGEYQKPPDESLFDQLLFIGKEKYSDFVFWTKTGAEKIGTNLKRSARDTRTEAQKILREKIQTLILKVQERKLAAKKKALPKKESSRPPLAPSPNMSLQEKSAAWLLAAKTKISTLSWRKLLPNFSKIRRLLAQMDHQQRVYSALALLAIFIVPLLWIKFQDRARPLPPPEAPVEMTPEQILANDKNIHFNPQLTTVYSAANFVGATLSNNTLFAITEKQLIKIDNNQPPREFSVAAADGSKIVAYFEMKDLNLIFLLTDQNKLISFSSISDKFQENSLAIPPTARIASLAAYLTYAYAVDTSNNQIYRYPRAEAEGGFGEKTDWLKETLDLQNVSDMAIDENIYLATGENILKLLKGKREEFNLEQSATPLKFRKIFTNIDTENIYILDQESGRLVKYAKSGELLAQYYDARLKDAAAFTVDEKNNKAYFTTAQELIALNL